MKKWLLLALPLLLISFTFAQTETTIENILSWDMLTWAVSTEITIKCYKEIAAKISAQYKTKREGITSQKVEIKALIRTLMAERKNTKEKLEKSEIKYQIKSLESQIWNLNEEDIFSYRLEYKEKFHARKYENPKCK